MTRSVCPNVCLSCHCFPAGNLRTTDNGAPYNLSLLNVQEAEIKSTHLCDLCKAVDTSSVSSVVAVLTIADSYALPCAAGGIAAKQNYTDHDIVNFLTNVECLEGQFDTWGAFGFGFIGKQIRVDSLHTRPQCLHSLGQRSKKHILQNAG